METMHYYKERFMNKLKSLQMLGSLEKAKFSIEIFGLPNIEKIHESTFWWKVLITILWNFIRGIW